MTGLLGNHGKRCALLFCLDHTESFAIHQQQIVTAPGFERDFAQRDTAPGGRVERLVILNDPTRRDKLCVDLLAGLLFGSHADWRES